MENLRKPLFFLAVFLLVVAVLAEIGATAVLGDRIPGAGNLAKDMGAGYGIPFMVLLDGLVLFTVSLIGASLVIPERIHGRVQGIITLVVSLLAVVAAFVMIWTAVLFLSLMLGLLLSPIFGTIAYFTVYSYFDTEGARILLSLIMALKLGFAGCLVLAHPRFLQNKGLVLIVLTSLLANLIVGFLHSLVPVFLVSITDVLAAIVVTLLAAIWAVFFLFGSVVSVVKAIH